MPAENPIIGTGGYEFGSLGLPTVNVYQSGLPSATASNAMYSSADTASMSNAAGTNEAIATNLAVLIAVALIGIFVFRQAGIRFAFAVGAGRR